MIDRLVIQGRLLLVDDVLPADECTNATAHMESVAVKDVEIDSEFSIWKRNAPLNPQVGPTIMWPESPEHREIVAALPGVHQYPTRTPFDRIIEVAREKARLLGLLTTETEDDSFAGLIASVYSYGPGTRLVWHNDAAYLGAFSAYLSSHWSADEGGHFAFGEGPAESEAGLARIVEPRPNRLVVFGSGVRHSVLPVSNDARQPRRALSGFFVRRRHAEQLLTQFLKDLTRRTS